MCVPVGFDARGSYNGDTGSSLHCKADWSHSWKANDAGNYIEALNVHFPPFTLFHP